MIGPSTPLFETSPPRPSREQRAAAIRDLQAALIRAGKEADQAQVAWLSEQDPDTKWNLQVIAYDKLAAAQLLRDRLDDVRRQAV